MKQFLSTIVLIGLLSGCTTVPVTHEDACAVATSAYAIYLAIINADGQPSNDQILAARAAAEVLRTQCGWTLATGTAKTRKSLIDSYNVPILFPPK